MSEKRKSDHIKLTFESQTSIAENMGLVYEPMLAGMEESPDLSIELAGKKMKAPLWISSMTGGTGIAKSINENLARAAGKKGIGMGLGSCRSLLFSNERLEDFAVRKFIGDSPLYANLGIAQVEALVEDKQQGKLAELVDKVEADGLIIHVNPLQEYMQPEGDKIKFPPIQTIERVLEAFDKPLIIKEVGQGMGPESLKRLCALPLAGIEFAAFGGTNFTKIEQARHKSPNSGTKSELSAFANVGHSAAQMIDWVNQIQMASDSKCPLFIISGGVGNMLSGHALRTKLNAPSLIGMAQAYLKHALVSAQAVEEFIQEQIEALELANLYLKRNALENN